MKHWKLCSAQRLIGSFIVDRRREDYDRRIKLVNDLIAHGFHLYPNTEDVYQMDVYTEKAATV